MYIKCPSKWAFGWVEKISINPLKIVARAYTSHVGPGFLRIFWFFRLAYQIDQFFALIKNMQTKIPTNAYFDQQRAVKLGYPELKTFKWPFLGHFWFNCFFLLWGTFLGSISASCQRN